MVVVLVLLLLSSLNTSVVVTNEECPKTFSGKERRYSSSFAGTAMTKAREGRAGNCFVRGRSGVQCWLV